MAAAAVPLLLLEGAALTAFAPALISASMVGYLGWQGVKWLQASVRAAAAAKATAKAVAMATAKQAADQAAAALAAAQSSAAQIATEKIAEVAVGSVTTSMWPWIVVGSVAFALVAGGMYYYYYHYLPQESSTHMRSAKPKGAPSAVQSARARSRPRRPSDSEDSDDEPPKISRRQMKKLLNKDGPNMFEKLRHNLLQNPNFKGTAWPSDPAAPSDTRIDVGFGNVSRNRPLVKNWHLQINRQATSPWARKLLSRMAKKGTHGIVLRGKFDVGNVPSYNAWLKAILDQFV